MNGDLGTAAGRGDLVRLALRLIVEETPRSLKRAGALMAERLDGLQHPRGRNAKRP